MFLTGGEGIGWALDIDLEMARRSFQSLPRLIQFTSLESADIVWSVYALALTAMEDWQLTGKRIVCQMDNDVFWLMHQPYMTTAREIAGLWIAQNTEAFSQATCLGMPTRLVPYSVDTGIFRPELPEGISIPTLKKQWQIPEGKFVIGNFMRDTLGEDLSKPKTQKGADVFLSIVSALRARNLPIHVLLVGPRRHWLRRQLEKGGIPFTYIGKVIKGDDISKNILDHKTLNLLYHILDLYALTSRWEGGPRPVLEAAATRCKILSTPVGLAPDVLDPICIFRTVDQGINLVEREIRESFLASTLDAHLERIRLNHTPDANVSRFEEVLKNINEIPPYQPSTVRKNHSVIKVPSRIRIIVDKVANRLSRSRRNLNLPGRGLRVSLWHEFKKPPYGGGNQFMQALQAALQNLGCTVYKNRLSRDVDVHICNSTWFDVNKFSGHWRHNPARMLHRIDGPIALYRGSDRTIDDQIFELNTKFASATVVQSAWCYEQLCQMGYRPLRPIIIHNAVDGRIFYKAGRLPFSRDRKIRLISTSWSDNPRKGGPIYKWIEEHLDWDRFDYTFVGRTKGQFKRIRHIPPVPSKQLADMLRQHDIYITASKNDPCSNALIEALACGLPALYLDDGGHPELVRHGGLPFQSEQEILPKLDLLVENYELFQSMIVVQTIDSVAKTYIEIARDILN